MAGAAQARSRVLAEVDEAADELVDFTRRLVRIPTVNPPGDRYLDAAELIGSTLESHGFEVRRLTPVDRPEHSSAHPRVNVLGALPGTAPRPGVHLNGHFDVVPAGDLDSALDTLTTALMKEPRPAILAVKEYASAALTMDIAGAVALARNLHATVNSADGMRG